MTAKHFTGLAEHAGPRLRRLEHLIRPRPSWLTGAAGRRLLGAVLVILALVLALPVPLGNSAVGAAVVIIALGLLEGDGAALGWGLAAGAAALAWNGLVLFASSQLLAAYLFRWF
jgi:hypothetical protein